MDSGLFSKHLFQIKKVHDIKEEVLVLVQERTGIVLQVEEIVVNNKRITIQASSVKRMMLLQKNIKAVLQEKGYTLAM